MSIGLAGGILVVAVAAGSLDVAVPTGTWGGKHIRMVVTETGAKVEYDCATGTIDEPIRPDKDGNFEARGGHVIARGGPRSRGEAPPPVQPALYRGWADGSHMRVSVTLPDTRTGVGSFSLVFGSSGDLDRCL